MSRLTGWAAHVFERENNASFVQVQNYTWPEHQDWLPHPFTLVSFISVSTYISMRTLYSRDKASNQRIEFKQDTVMRVWCKLERNQELDENKHRKVSHRNRV